jgi:hypothetical protein
MPNDPDTTYLVERERAERCMAANAKCPEAAKAHLEMAATYRRLADEARRRAKAEPRQTWKSPVPSIRSNGPLGGGRN